MEKLLILL